VVCPCEHGNVPHKVKNFVTTSSCVNEYVPFLTLKMMFQFT